MSSKDVTNDVTIPWRMKVVISFNEEWLIYRHFYLFFTFTRWSRGQVVVVDLVGWYGRASNGEIHGLLRLVTASLEYPVDASFMISYFFFNRKLELKRFLYGNIVKNTFWCCCSKWFYLVYLCMINDNSLLSSFFFYFRYQINFYPAWI